MGHLRQLIERAHHFKLMRATPGECEFFKMSMWHLRWMLAMLIVCVAQSGGDQRQLSGAVNGVAGVFMSAQLLAPLLTDLFSRTQAFEVVGERSARGDALLLSAGMTRSG